MREVKYFCEECNTEVTLDLEVCPKCGNPIDEKNLKKQTIITKEDNTKLIEKEKELSELKKKNEELEKKTKELEEEKNKELKDAKESFEKSFNESYEKALKEQKENLDKASKNQDDLQKELDTVKSKLDKYEGEKFEHRKQTIAKTKNAGKKTLSIIVTIIRYILGIFWCLGVIAAITEPKNMYLLVPYILLALSFFPFTYKPILKKVNDRSLQIIMQVFTPFIVFVLTIIYVIIIGK